MTLEADHEVTDERGYPLTRLTSIVVALAKNAELHSSSNLTVPPEECADVRVSLGKSIDNVRSSLALMGKTIVKEFGRNAESEEYRLLTRHSRIMKAEFDE